MVIMNLLDATTDQAVLEELGARLARRRVSLRLQQAELAERAGVGKRTVERIEAGESCQLTSWVRVLRVLELLPALDALLPEESIRPMEMIRHHRKRMPKRVRKRADEIAPSNTNESRREWRWGDDD